MPAVIKTFLTWIITIAGGALTLLAMGNGTSDNDYVGSISLMGAAYSIPGMAGYHFAVLFIYRRNISLISKKIFLALTSVGIVALSGIVAFPEGGILLIPLILYAPSLALCALIFNYSSNVTTVEEDTAIGDNSGGTHLKRLQNTTLIFNGIAVITNITSFFQYSRFNSSTAKFAMLYSAIFVILNTVMVITATVLLLQKRKGGWYIQYVLSAMWFLSIISTLASFNLYFKYFKWQNILMSVFFFVAAIIQLFLLNKKQVRNYFNISDGQRVISLVVAILIALSYRLVWYLTMKQGHF